MIGGLLYASTGQSVLAFSGILTSNMALLTLLAMLPWLNSVVRSGRFDRSLNTLMKVNVSDLGKLYIRSSATTLTLAASLNLSAATISQDVLKTNFVHVNKRLRDSYDNCLSFIVKLIMNIAPVLGAMFFCLLESC